MHIIAGLYKNRPLKSPKGVQTRPTSNKMRAAVFNILQNQIEGCDFLDLFAGSGAMGIEALSRGAHAALFVDNNRYATEAIKSNLEMFKLSSQVLSQDVFKALSYLKGKRQFDIIYADPPYQTKEASLAGEPSVGAKLVEVIDGADLLKEQGMFFVEESKYVAWPIQLKTLKLLSSRQFGNTFLQQYVRL